LHEVKLTNLLKVLVFVGYSDFHALFTSVTEVCCLNMQGMNVLIIILPPHAQGPPVCLYKKLISFYWVHGTLLKDDSAGFTTPELRKGSRIKKGISLAYLTMLIDIL
jgi:hypothetical protein